MEFFENNRLNLIAELLKEKERSSAAFMKFTAIPREYDGDELLYMREAHFIMAVQPGEGHTMSEIAEKLDVTQGAISQIAARLEKKGYVLRKRSKENYRQVVAVLTEKGERLYHQHFLYDLAEFQRADDAYFSRFSEEQLQLLLTYERDFQDAIKKKFS